MAMTAEGYIGCYGNTDMVFDLTFIYLLFSGATSFLFTEYRYLGVVILPIPLFSYRLQHQK